MIKKSFFSVISLISVLILSSCSNTPSSSVSDSSAIQSITSASDSISSTSAPDSSFLNLVAGMKAIPMNSGKAAVPEEVAYNENGVLGTAARPLSGNKTCSTLSIKFYEMMARYGDAIFITCDETTIVMDFGVTSSSNLKFENELASDYAKFDNIDLLLLSHPHEDHLEALKVFKSYLALPGGGFRDIKMIVDYGWTYSTNMAKEYQTLRADARSRGSQYCTISNAINSYENCRPRTYITKNLFIDWLETSQYVKNSVTNTYNASSSSSSDANATSLTGILNFNDFSFYFSGDLNESGENKIISSANEAKNKAKLHEVTLSKATHHGSENGNSTALFNVIKPQIIQISAGADMASNNMCGGHPYSSAITRMIASPNQVISPNVYLNSINGTTTYITNGYQNVYMQGSARYRSLVAGNKGNASFSLNDTDTSLIYTELKDTPYYKVCQLGVNP